MEQTVDCPYCGESIDVHVDAGVQGAQSYVEDCWVCCQPIAIVAVGTGDGEAEVSARRLDE